MITNGQEVSAYGHEGQGDDSKNNIIQTITGFSSASLNELEKHFMEEISLNSFMRTLRKDSKCPDTTNIDLIIGKIVLSKGK